MDGGVITAIGASVSTLIAVVVGASYHIGVKLGKCCTQMEVYHESMNAHHDRLESLEDDCKRIPVIEEKVDALGDRTGKLEDAFSLIPRRRRAKSV